MHTRTIVLEILTDGAEAQRKPGYYWVRRLGESTLKIAHWDGDEWSIAGTHVRFCDDSFAVISLDPIRRVD